MPGCLTSQGVGQRKRRESAGILLNISPAYRPAKLFDRYIHKLKYFDTLLPNVTLFMHAFGIFRGQANRPTADVLNIPLEEVTDTKSNNSHLHNVRALRFSKSALLKNRDVFTAFLCAILLVYHTIYILYYLYTILFIYHIIYIACYLQSYQMLMKVIRWQYITNIIKTYFTTL